MAAFPLRRKLELAVKYLAVVFGLVLCYVFLDSLIDFRPAGIHDSYQFKLPRLIADKPVFLRQDNLVVVVLRRSGEVITGLQRDVENLQDPESKKSKQPRYATNRLRSRYPEYFVSYAFGTDLGCKLEEVVGEFKEICGSARYDFAGRALTAENKFSNLVIPDYNFTNDFNTLTIKP